MPDVQILPDTGIRIRHIHTKREAILGFFVVVVMRGYPELSNQSKRVGKGIFVSREWSIFVRVKCEMLDFSVVKCDLFYSREA